MNFRIADTFTDSLAKLTGEEQKVVKTTAFDLQLNPANPGMSFHKLNKAKDKNFWSIRVSDDLRIIVHKTSDSLLLCYVNHHDKAYQWAERRKLETHPKTGAAQIVEVRETIQEIPVPVYVPAEASAPSKPLLFAEIATEELLSYGVPEEWLEDVRAANEDSILDLADHLPSEASEALLDLAVGVTPQSWQFVARDVNPFDHPDAKRRFRLMTNVEELERALDYPWEKWTVFLHPDQRDLVERNFNGPARVSGSAGTGKTIVALHRAVSLTRSNPDARVLLTTFSGALANALRTKLKRLIGNEPRLGDRLEVYDLDSIGERLYGLNFGKPKIASKKDIQGFLQQAAEKVEGHKFTSRFLITEWELVVDAWQLSDWESYRDVVRLGRKTRLPETQRKQLWSIFEQVQAELKNRGLVTFPDMFSNLAEKLAENKNPPFDFVVIDEAQDVSVAQLRFLAALGAGRENSLFFAGDLGQRIFQQPFSWKSLGVDIRARSRTLQVNYRTSHQIRMQADLLLGPEISDVDGNKEDRNKTISVFNGPKPDILEFNSFDDEAQSVGEWLRARMSEGLMPHEFGVFVRSATELDRAKAAVEIAKIPFVVLDEKVETVSGKVSISTMHLAKGLEFRAVVVLACDDEIVPLQERIETVADDADLQEVYDTERHLLYVACTRARDHLLVTSGDVPSEFLDDLRVKI
ncbi:MAG: UvrD-helicase domain-containing protein [Deltaproteobacteria bacterium]|nr:UvrD-helicase domain-containing protein [Deltaproteobacteria bacterium]